MAITKLIISPPLLLVGQDGPAASSSTLSPPDPSSSPLTLGSIIAIVIPGAVILSTAAAFFCIWLARRRASARDPDIDFDLDDITTTTGGSGPRGPPPRKLRKKPWQVPSGQGSISPVRRISLPSHLPLFSRHSSFGSFSGGNRNSGDSSGNGSPERRRKTSWIDEDAIHGPKVARPIESRRRTIRESWPLRNMAPTLPRMHGQLRHQEASCAGTVPTVAGQVHRVPLRKLPQPPRPVYGVAEHHQQQDQQRVALILPLLRSYTYDDAPRQLNSMKANTAKARAVSQQHHQLQLAAARLRQSSTESTLSQILRSTEQRLQEGGSSGVARRNRLCAPPSKMSTTPSRGTPVSSGKSSGLPDGETPCQLREQSRTPSPSKLGQNVSLGLSQSLLAHKRQTSQSSVTSEPDSLYAEPAAGSQQTGLTSPSRSVQGRRQRPRAQSASSSVSSALSTVYSEDETREGSTFALTQATSAADPFLSSLSTLSRPTTSHDWKPASRGWQSLNCPQRLRNSTLVQGCAPGNTRTPAPYQPSRPESSLQYPAISPSNLFMYQLRTPSGPGSPCISVLLPPDLAASSLAAAADEVRPKASQASNPSFRIISPGCAPRVTAVSPDLSLSSLLHLQASLGPKRGESPSQELRPKGSSPTLGQAARTFPLWPRQPPQLPMLPAATSPSAAGADAPPSPTPIRRSSTSSSTSSCLAHVSRHIRVASAASSNYSAPPGETEAENHSSGVGAYAQANRKSVRLNAALSVVAAVDGARGPFAEGDGAGVGQAQMRRGGSTSTNASSTASASGGVGRAGTLRVAATVAELRRMNSQVSAYSAASSGYESGAGGNPPVLVPVLLRGGAGSVAPTAGPSRREGSWNYLSLGSPTRSSAGNGSGSPRTPLRGVAGGGVGKRKSGTVVRRLPYADMGQWNLDDGGTGKENNGGTGLKLPRLDMAVKSEKSTNDDVEGRRLREGSGANIGTPMSSSSVAVRDRDVTEVSSGRERYSQDSLGLYDKDGFLISSPIRAPGSESRGFRLRA